MPGHFPELAGRRAAGGWSMRKARPPASLGHQTMSSSRGMVALVSLALVVACQTSRQAKVVAVGTGSIGLIGGYVEYKTGVDDRLPPLTLISGGTIAIISAISILFLDERPRPYLKRHRMTGSPTRAVAPASWSPRSAGPVVSAAAQRTRSRSIETASSSTTA